MDAVDYVEEATLPNTKVIISDIMDAELPREHFDAVFISNFLEHLPTQEAVAAVLENMHESMRSGGKIGVLGPNFRYCVEKYFDCADHALVFTHVSIAEHLYAAGSTINKVIPKFLPYSFRGKLPASPPLVRLYLRSPIMWRVLGKQFLVIAEKELESMCTNYPHPVLVPQLWHV